MRLLASVDHAHVVAYLDSFVEVGSLHIVMEECEGGDLHSMLEVPSSLLSLPVPPQAPLYPSPPSFPLPERLRLSLDALALARRCDTNISFMFMQARRGVLLTEPDVWRLYTESLRGLQHLHSLKILHRDVKAGTAPHPSRPIGRPSRC